MEEGTLVGARIVTAGALVDGELGEVREGAIADLIQLDDVAEVFAEIPSDN
ncbi:MAG: hypothetical protein RLP45_06615 [Haliea sp.]|uniref:hypothetical protein n=1 Tax=Marinobacter salarius TaxID=1420917 RepID=UPI0032EC50EB